MACSIVSVVSTPKAMGTPVDSDDAGDPLGDLAGDVVEVRRRAADDAAEGDDRVDLPLDARGAAGERDLPRRRGRGRR